MSPATSEPRESKFLARFDHVWASLRRYQVRQGLASALLAAVLGLTVLAAADYGLELPWSARAAGLIVLVAVTLAVLWVRFISPLRWWTRPRTAAEIESRFPQLGQRIRTVVQYAGLPEELIHSEGVTPSLVDALEEQTEIQAQPLPLDRIVPWRRAWAVAVLAAVSALIQLVAATVEPQWRIALERALLGRREYTTLSVAPGNLTVEQGETVPITVELKGRLKRDVVLYTRSAGQAATAWKAIPLDVPDRGPISKRQASLEKVKEPLVYRVAAGTASSPAYRIGIRYPLALKSFDVALVPPAYTGVKPSKVRGGDLRVVEGTDATFQIAFDSPPAEATLVVTDPSPHSRKARVAPAPQLVPLKSDGTTYTAMLNLTKGLVYQVEATTPDGRALPRNRYKIEVLEDRPPRVVFEQPDEALEVHPIAEVLNRVRVGDDFGLTRAGIVFQFNSGDEQTLIVKDFPAEQAGPRTTAVLQEMLMLEKLAATPTDSVTYYAFAEDNYPAGARRTETELRYIDIRPFKREYKLADSASGLEGEGELISLAELIARQRFNLNRANRLAKHKPADKTIVDDPLKIAGFEEMLAGLTREFTEGIEGIVGERVEPLHAAEESMLAVVSALDHGQNARAPALMADALRHLIEARNTIRILIGQDPSASRAMRSFDRLQAQKIRKPRKDEEEAEEIAERLEELAQEEDFVYATLAAVMMEQQEGQASKGEETEKGEADPEKKDEPTENKVEGPKKAQGSNGEKSSGTGQGQGKGQGGKKGEQDDEDDPGEPRKDDRRDAMKRQEHIVDTARELEEKLKKLEAVSELARVRMAKAAETAEKAGGALSRGNTKEATETAKVDAAMLHELARQVKGEIAREVAQELAMARDLADELAEREAELGRMPAGNPDSGADQAGQAEKGQDGQNGSPGQDGQRQGQGASGTGGRGDGGWGNLTDTERLERLEEAARTLEHWLKDASLRAEGTTAERVREMLEESEVTRVVERMERIGELYLGGQKPAARRDAQELARVLEVLARQLDVLHRGIVAPELAALVEFDKRVAGLTAKLKTLKTDAEITEWHRLAAALIRDLEKAGLTSGAAALAGALEAGGWHGGAGAWHWGAGPHDYRLVPGGYTTALSSVTLQLHDKLQDLILKDIVSARDESTPPQFKELVERYYEVLSKTGASQ